MKRRGYCPCAFEIVVFANSDLIDKLGVVCAVKGAGPQREGIPPGTGSLHPVAIGAVVEVTELLKPLV